MDVHWKLARDGILDGIPTKAENKKALNNQGFNVEFWRREGDSNPR